jgi:hypothetical protein
MEPTRPAKLEQRSWNDMLLEIPVLVVELLPCVVDRDCFTASCRRWRSAVCKAGVGLAQLPMAMLPSPGTGATVLSVLLGSMRRIQLLPSIIDGSTRLCGCHRGGWLAVVGGHPSGGDFVTAVNHFTGAILPLPTRMVKLLSYSQLYGPYYTSSTAMDVQAVAFSADPSSPFC